MDLLFESTKKFEKELKKFTDRDKHLIVGKINQYCAFLLNEPKQFYSRAFKPCRLHLTGEYEDSLYALRVNKDIRVVLTVDEDPLFEQIIITLLHVARHSTINKVYKGIAESLYQKTLDQIENEG